MVIKRFKKCFILLALAAFHWNELPVVAHAQDTKEQEEARAISSELNRDFMDSDLDPQKFVERFELESREIFHGRSEILRACKIQLGDHVADIGAGTGFFSKMFAAATGENGWVYSVEVSPRFVEHLRKEFDSAGIENATPILTSQRTTNLAPNTVDLIFICDTYHHFEFPQTTLRSLYRALREGGTMVVIDFERIEDQSREWVMNHVRAGKETFRSEIEQAGFEFVEEVTINAFAENYFLRFRKPKNE